MAASAGRGSGPSPNSDSEAAARQGLPLKRQAAAGRDGGPAQALEPRPRAPTARPPMGKRGARAGPASAPPPRRPSFQDLLIGGQRVNRGRLRGRQGSAARPACFRTRPGQTPEREASLRRLFRLRLTTAPKGSLVFITPPDALRRAGASWHVVPLPRLLLLLKLAGPLPVIGAGEGRCGKTPGTGC